MQLRFGEPFKCNRKDAKCFKCKKEIAEGDNLVWEFSERHRYHVECAAEVKAEQDKPVQVVGNVELGPETLRVLVKCLTTPVTIPATKTGLFTGGSPSQNPGMTSDQTRAFNDMARRLELVERELKEVKGV